MVPDSGGAESGKTITVADSLRGEAVAEQMLQQLAQATGLPVRSDDSHSSSLQPHVSHSTPATPLASANPSHAGEASSPLKLGLAALFMLPFVVLGLSLLLFGVAPTLVDWARASSGRPPRPSFRCAATLWEPGPRGRGQPTGWRCAFATPRQGQDTGGSGHHCTSAMATPVSYHQQLGERLEAGAAHRHTGAGVG